MRKLEKTAHHPVSATKKDQIATLYQLGITNVDELATLTGAKPSYVAQVLRDSRVLHGYFDLYTSTDWPMNVYSRYFAGRLGFKNVATARRSVHYINTLYQQFGRTEDRAGQHHALLMALTMRNRAHWSGKTKEAKIYGDWLIEQLEADNPPLSAAEKMEQRLQRQVYQHDEVDQ